MTDLSVPVEPEKCIYNYDPIGNRKTATEGTTDTTYTPNALNQYASVVTESPVYDDDGNQTNYEDKIFTDNGENRLIVFEPASPVKAEESKRRFIVTALILGIPAQPPCLSMTAGT